MLVILCTDRGIAMSIVISFILGANVGFLLTCIIVSGKDK